MPRVLLDFRVRTGGVGRYGRQLATALERSGGRWEVDVFAPEPSGHHAPFTPWGRRAVARRAARGRADVVHGLHLEVPRRSQSPAVLTVQDVIPLQHPSSMSNPIRRRVFEATLRASVASAAVVVVPSAATAAALQAVQPAAARKVMVIPHAVDDVFSPIAPEAAAAARARFAGGRPYVASLWNDRPHKNLAAAVAAARLVTARGDVAWAAVGGPPGGSLAAVPALTDGELARFYAAAEVVVVPSRVEGFGYAVVEALACGTPVVCGSGVGAVEFVRGGVVLVDVADAAEIAGAVAAVLRDAGLRERLARTGTAAAARLRAEAMAAATLNAYELAMRESTTGTTRTRTRPRRRSSRSR